MKSSSPLKMKIHLIQKPEFFSTDFKVTSYHHAKGLTRNQTGTQLISFREIELTSTGKALPQQITRNIPKTLLSIQELRPRQVSSLMPLSLFTVSIVP